MKKVFSLLALIGVTFLSLIAIGALGSIIAYGFRLTNYILP